MKKQQAGEHSLSRKNSETILKVDGVRGKLRQTKQERCSQRHTGHVNRVVNLIKGNKKLLK